MEDDRSGGPLWEGLPGSCLVTVLSWDLGKSMEWAAGGVGASASVPGTSQLYSLTPLGLPASISELEVRIPVLFWHLEGWGVHNEHCQARLSLPLWCSQPTSGCLHVLFFFFSEALPSPWGYFLPLPGRLEELGNKQHGSSSACDGREQVYKCPSSLTARVPKSKVQVLYWPLGSQQGEISW